MYCEHKVGYPAFYQFFYDIGFDSLKESDVREWYTEYRDNPEFEDCYDLEDYFKKACTVNR